VRVSSALAAEAILAVLVCKPSAAAFRRMLVWALVYALTVGAVVAAFLAKLVPALLVVPVALLPMVPAAFVPFMILGKLRSVDELQRKIVLEAIAFAFVAGVLVSLGYGFLQAFAGAPDINWVWVWPLFGACLFIGILIGRRRYR
jgi:hypothetical protein